MTQADVSTLQTRLEESMQWEPCESASAAGEVLVGAKA